MPARSRARRRPHRAAAPLPSSRRRGLRLTAVLVSAAAALAACAQGGAGPGAAPASASGSAPAQAGGPVILIGNQPFGDHGPMDDMAAGLATCAQRFGFKTKQVVALSPSEYDSSIRSAAQGGYKLVLTTFPQMATATMAVAGSFPDVKFGAVYQDINDQGGATLPNVWGTSFDVTAASYVEGSMAARLSKSGKLGMIVGDLDPTISASLNAFARGAKSVNPAARLQWANSNTFIDPAKGKDLAQAMISRGVDVVATSAGQTQLGALDAAKAAGIYFFGDNGDNSGTYPEGFVSDLRSELGKNVVDACADFAGGTFKGGTHSVYDLTNDGADLDTALVTKWGKAAGQQQVAGSLVTMYDNLLSQVRAGTLKIPVSTEAPASEN